MNRKSVVPTVFLTVIALFVLTVSGNAFGWDPRKEQSLIEHSNEAIQAFKEKDSTLQVFFDEAVGWVVYPTVAKGAVGIGAATGSGVVYNAAGDLLGKSRITQVTIGFQLGGQAYSEIVFFETENDLNHFKGGNLEFAAQASAVAVTARAAADANYEKGVAIFTMAKGGLMYEASIGGQKLSFEPLD